MTDLQPHRHPRPPAPLSAGARFIRGFTRVGAIAAVLVVLIGVMTSIVGGVVSYGTVQDTHRSAQCVARLARSGYTFKKMEYSSSLDYGEAGCRDYHLSYLSVSEVIAMADTPAPTFLTSDAASFSGWALLITGLVAVAAYLAFWAIGWLCAGFTRDT